MGPMGPMGPMGHGLGGLSLCQMFLAIESCHELGLVG
jgi:hypothetical protein